MRQARLEHGDNGGCGWDGPDGPAGASEEAVTGPKGELRRVGLTECAGKGLLHMAWIREAGRFEKPSAKPAAPTGISETEGKPPGAVVRGTAGVGAWEVSGVLPRGKMSCFLHRLQICHWPLRQAGGSQPGVILPLGGTLATCRDISNDHNLGCGCYQHVAGGGQRCCPTSYGVAACPQCPAVGENPVSIDRSLEAPSTFQHRIS